jgi:hypothetical protein
MNELYLFRTPCDLEALPRARRDTDLLNDWRRLSSRCISFSGTPRMNTEDIYLIWSAEHSAWWMPGGRGYTKSLSTAGRYDKKSALKICIAAVPGTADRLGALPELPVRLADIVDMLDGVDPRWHGGSWA